MTRPDLKPEYDGWQVVDPTPQEKSEGDSPMDINYIKACSLKADWEELRVLIIALNNSGSVSLSLLIDWRCCWKAKLIKCIMCNNLKHLLNAGPFGW